MEEKTNSIQKTARIAGVLYLLITALSIPVHFVIPAQLIVAGDAAPISKSPNLKAS